MNYQKLDVESFLKQSRGQICLDVRSPSEYAHAHIPKATSFPLFSDEERKKIGTLYKQVSKESAIKAGLQIFGPSMLAFVEKAEQLTQNDLSKPLFVHCWRGGMRSGAIAWLLSLYGYKVYTLQGGYKAFRNWVLQTLEKPWKLLVLGGYTGSHKTEILHQLQKKGEAIIDLEELAQHRGSAFGHLGLPEQKSVEQFENELALVLWHNAQSGHSYQWIESESQRLGKVNLPKSFFSQMIEAPLVFLDVPAEIRLQHVLADYGKFEKEALVHGVLRIRKRLGGLETKNCMNFILEDNQEEAFKILLAYYDRWYTKSQYINRQKVLSVNQQSDQDTKSQLISELIAFRKSLINE